MSYTLIYAYIYIPYIINYICIVNMEMYMQQGVAVEISVSTTSLHSCTPRNNNKRCHNPGELTITPT